MDTSPCCSKKRLNRATWSRKEDMLLSEHIRIHGDSGRWTNLPKKLGLQRTGKSCRLRWLNYLRPDIRRGNISPDEDKLIIRLHRLLGNRWSLIAGRLPGRTGNEIKNYWNTHLSKKLLSMDDSQTNLTEQYLKKRSKSPSTLQNPVFKTSSVKITTAVTHSETARADGSNGYGCSNRSSQEACSVAISNSTSWCDLPVSDSNVNLVKAQGRNSTSTMSSLVDEESPHSNNLAGDTGTLAESSPDLDALSSPHWNLPLFFASDYSTDFGVEELDRRAAMEMNEFDDIMCSDESYMQHFNSLTVADHEGMEGFYDNTQQVNWIHGLDYLHDLDS
eukprot:PITA_36235